MGSVDVEPETLESVGEARLRLIARTMPPVLRHSPAPFSSYG